MGNNAVFYAELVLVSGDAKKHAEKSNNDINHIM